MGTCCLVFSMSAERHNGMCGDSALLGCCSAKFQKMVTYGEGAMLLLVLRSKETYI